MESKTTKPFYNTTIPSDWEVNPLYLLAEKVGSGITPKGGGQVYKKEGRPFLRSQNIGWGSLILDDVVFIDEKTHESFKNTEIQEEDVFLNITGASIGRSSVSNRSIVGGNVNQHVCIIRTKKSVLIPAFLNSFLLSTIGQNLIDSFQAGGNRQGLNFEQIKSFKIPLPSLPEQRAIAQVLSLMDTAIDKNNQLIAQKELCKKWLMQNLLTGKKRLNQNFQDERINRIEMENNSENHENSISSDSDNEKRLKGFNGEWKEIQLGEMFKERNETKFYKLPLLSIGQNGVYPQEESIKKDTSNEDKSKYKRICPGDIGYNTMRMWQGRSALSELEGIVSPAYTIVTPKKNADSLFFSYLFKTPKLTNLFWRNSQGLVDDTLNCKFKDFSIVKVVLPQTKEEQTAIAQVLQKADKEISLLKAKAEKLREQKKGLMQVLLTGKKRLNLNLQD